MAAIEVTIGVAVGSVFFIEYIVQLEDQVGLFHDFGLDGIDRAEVLYIVAIQFTVFFLCVVQVFFTHIFTQEAQLRISQGEEIQGGGAYDGGGKGDRRFVVGIFHLSAIVIIVIIFRVVQHFVFAQGKVGLHGEPIYRFDSSLQFNSQAIALWDIDPGIVSYVVDLSGQGQLVMVQHVIVGRAPGITGIFSLQTQFTVMQHFLLGAFIDAGFEVGAICLMAGERIG